MRFPDCLEHGGKKEVAAGNRRCRSGNVTQPHHSRLILVEMGVLRLFAGTESGVDSVVHNIIARGTTMAAKKPAAPAKPAGKAAPKAAAPAKPAAKPGKKGK